MFHAITAAAESDGNGESLSYLESLTGEDASAGLPERE
jgi:hypothetical protein